MKPLALLGILILLVFVIALAAEAQIIVAPMGEDTGVIRDRRWNLELYMVMPGSAAVSELTADARS